MLRKVLSTATNRSRSAAAKHPGSPSRALTSWMVLELPSVDDLDSFKTLSETLRKSRYDGVNTHATTLNVAREVEKVVVVDVEEDDSGASC